MLFEKRLSPEERVKLTISIDVEVKKMLEQIKRDKKTSITKIIQTLVRHHHRQHNAIKRLV